MKVMCIKEDSRTIRGYYKGPPLLKLGEIYEVAEVTEWEGDYYYRIYIETEFRFLDFIHKLFARISDIDEKELIKERELVTI